LLYDGYKLTTSIRIGKPEEAFSESIFEAGRKVAVSKVYANTKNYPFVSITSRTSDDA